MYRPHFIFLLTTRSKNIFQNLASVRLNFSSSWNLLHQGEGSTYDIHSSENLYYQVSNEFYIHIKSKLALPSSVVA